MAHFSAGLALAGAALVAACEPEPTDQEENLSARGEHPTELAQPGPGNAQVTNAPPAGDPGDSAGISGSTQGPKAGESDAPYGGESGSR